MKYEWIFGLKNNIYHNDSLVDSVQSSHTNGAAMV